jgi:hypothetical protein
MNDKLAVMSGRAAAIYFKSPLSDFYLNFNQLPGRIENPESFILASLTYHGVSVEGQPFPVVASRFQNGRTCFSQAGQLGCDLPLSLWDALCGLSGLDCVQPHLQVPALSMLCDASAQQHESVVDAERKVCRANLAAHLSSKITITNTTWRTFSSKFDEQVDEWTVTEVGCPCYFDREARENMCACCQKDAVSCGAERSHRCVPRGRGDLCALEDDKRPTAARSNSSYLMRQQRTQHMQHMQRKQQQGVQQQQVETTRLEAAGWKYTPGRLQDQALDKPGSYSQMHRVPGGSH